MSPEVVIVGAGAAGVGAGLALQARGIPFVILEAANRIGGRAYTDKTSLPYAWDHGCHWFHCADVNPLVPWADRLGTDYDRRADIGGVMIWQNGGWLDDAQVAAADRAIDEGFDQIYAMGRSGTDMPLSRILPANGPWAGLLRNIARLMSSGDPEAVSAVGYATYEDTQVNWPVRSGLGDLIARMAIGLPVRLSTAATGIDYRPGGVVVRTEAGDIEARAAIVTASTNVLATGGIAFGPGPALEVVDLVRDVPLGSYEKIAVALRRLPVEPGERAFCWIEPGQGMGLNFQFGSGGEPMMIAHVGGQEALDMGRAGREEMITLAVERLVQAFGSGVRGEIIGAEVTGWQANPFVRGAYSYTKPGLSARRMQMIAAEAGAVIFAGEAFSPNWYATAHGAYQSGVDAAGRV